MREGPEAQMYTYLSGKQYLAQVGLWFMGRDSRWVFLFNDTGVPGSSRVVKLTTVGKELLFTQRNGSVVSCRIRGIYGWIFRSTACENSSPHSKESTQE